MKKQRSVAHNSQIFRPRKPKVEPPKANTNKPVTLWESIIVLCFVVRYFMSILVLQSSWWGRESWLLCLICFTGVSWWLSSSSSRCHGVVCGLWLRYFLIILTYYFLRNHWGCAIIDAAIATNRCITRLNRWSWSAWTHDVNTLRSTNFDDVKIHNTWRVWRSGWKACGETYD